MHRLAVVLPLLCAALVSGAAASRVDIFSYPSFDATTTQDLVAASNAWLLLSASALFIRGDVFAKYNRTEGFLLLSRAVDVWRPGPTAIPALEASFHTSFKLAGVAPVAFVVLIDRYPTLGGRDSLRGSGNYSSPYDGVSAAVDTLASVEVGPVRSYGRDDPAVGLNVTVTPNVTAAMTRTVWIDYDAAAHRLSVRVAGDGEPRPSKALLDAPLALAGRRTTETAFVGFFAAALQDIIVGVRDWDLTVDSFRKKRGTSWWVILLAVLGSVAATASIVTVAVCYFQCRRRRRQQLDMQSKM
ncbi:hypothetical protein HU200_012639 [Digitaria exilis]|uniref:Legume lectin domain-containing protein n=1 Tax=Digitaria exilis TaxID=1010633 RepID=A0A835FDZ2_9POAL|nr:hypothetical protein HU200_012639 [Digitaria exilis]CAB3486389.1 unnamed protein product [Digitaria exilis]